MGARFLGVCGGDTGAPLVPNTPGEVSLGRAACGGAAGSAGKTPASLTACGHAQADGERGKTQHLASCLHIVKHSHTL